MNSIGARFSSNKLNIVEWHNVEIFSQYSPFEASYATDMLFL